MNMMKLFAFGDEIYGYCNGYFGRDDYDDKICVLVRPKYAVFEVIRSDLGNNLGSATVLNYSDSLYEEMIDRWKAKPMEDEANVAQA